MTSGIYAFVHVCAEQTVLYIGKSVNMEQRRGKHFYDLDRGGMCNRLFQRAWDNCAWDDEEFITWEILREMPGATNAELFAREMLEIAHYRKHVAVYNLNEGGEGCSNPSEETRRKMSQAQKGRPGTMTGRRHSEEARRKMSKAQKGRRWSEESRRKMSKVAKNRSEEHRRRLGEALKGKRPSDDALRKNSEWHKGKRLSDETRRKLSAAQKNPSLETRRKRSEALKGHEVSEDTRRKLSERSKNITEETRRKRSESLKRVWAKRKTGSVDHE